MRRKRSPIRKIISDAKYNNVLVARFINYVMLDGKKSICERAVYSAFSMLEHKLKDDPLKLFKEIVDKITPAVEVRARRIGGSTYQVPVPVKERRGVVLALKWLTIAIRKQSGKSLSEKIFRAFNDVLNNTGWAYKKKEEVFKMVEANRAFAHFAW